MLGYPLYLLLLLITSVMALGFSPTVCSEFNPILLPSNGNVSSSSSSSSFNPSVAAAGPCPGPVDPGVCPVKCFRTDPVCGADGITYWCGCAEALCAGSRVTKIGFCEVGNGGSSGQALLLVHITWLILLGFFVLFGLL